MAEVGPDGNVWIIDWYNYIVQHNPTPAGFKTGRGSAYETDLRDKKHGRIYRIVYEGEAGKKQGPYTLADATKRTALGSDTAVGRAATRSAAARSSDPWSPFHVDANSPSALAACRPMSAAPRTPGQGERTR